MYQSKILFKFQSQSVYLFVHAYKKLFYIQLVNDKMWAHLQGEIVSLMDGLERTRTVHSALIRNLIKLKGTTNLIAQGEQVCLKDSKYILFVILATHCNGC